MVFNLLFEMSKTLSLLNLGKQFIYSILQLLKNKKFKLVNFSKY